MKYLDALFDVFVEAPNYELQQPAFELLLKGYKHHFGDNYEDVLNILLNHMGSDLLDFLADTESYSEIKR